MKLVNLKISKNSINNKLLRLTIFIFLFGRYSITLKNEFPGISNTISVFSEFSSFAILIYSLILLNYNSKNIKILFLFLLFLISYQTIEIHSITPFIYAIIGLFLAELYENDKESIVKLYFFSGLIFFAMLLILIFQKQNIFSLLINSINGRNYIGSAIFIFTLSGFLLSNKKNFISSFLGGIFLLILKFRTAILSLFIFLLLKHKNKIKFYLILLLTIISTELLFGLKSILYKWEGANLTSGRFDPWIYYSSNILDFFPISLFPYALRESLYTTNVYHFISEETGLFHAPHNLIIDLIYRCGIILSFVLLIIIFAPIVISKKNDEKIVYISLLIFSMFEPSIGYSTNLITLFFYMIFFNLIKKINFNL